MTAFRKLFRRRRTSAADEAAAWLARRDRGLSATEQDAYLQWLGEDPRNSEAVASADATLRRLMKLAANRATSATEADPDLLARRIPRSRWIWTMPIAAAAAAFLLMVTSHRVAMFGKPHATPAVARQQSPYFHTNDRRALPDGSIVELRDGSRITVQYTGAERRIRLEGGEAQFSVVKDPSRPFVVESDGVAVRAVGTVFDVRLDPSDVDVLVTEGRVRVGRAAADGDAIFAGDLNEHDVPFVGANQRALVARDNRTTPPAVTSLAPDDLARALSWTAPRLVFQQAPLAAAIAEFNQRNHRQLRLADPTLGGQLIAGSFRPDNLDGFVWFLTDVMHLHAEPHGSDVLELSRQPGR